MTTTPSEKQPDPHLDPQGKPRTHDPAENQVGPGGIRPDGTRADGTGQGPSTDDEDDDFSAG